MDGKESEGPKLRQLVGELKSVSDWHTLGILLDVNEEKLREIRADFSSYGVVRCRSELLSHWLHNSSNVSWENLASALEKMDEEKLAKEIWRKHTSLAYIQQQEMKESKIPSVVKIEEDVKFQVVHIKKRFAATITSTISTMEEENVSFEAVRAFSVSFLGIDFCEIEKVDSLDKLLCYLNGRHYCFLNTEALEVITEHFSHKAHTLLCTYTQELESFVTSIKVHQFMQAVLATADESREEDMLPVTLKLQSKWLDVTVKDLLKLVERVFSESRRVLVKLQVSHGCVCCRWYTTASAVKNLTRQAKEKTVLLKNEGVLVLCVGTELIMKDEETLKELFADAVHAGDISAVEHLLSYGLNIDQKMNGGKTALMLSIIHSGQTAMVNFLIKQGADLEITTEDGHTALMYAVFYGSTKIVQLLLNKQVNVNQQNENGNTALMVAARYNHTNLVGELLKGGSSCDLQDKVGDTALMFSCMFHDSPSSIGLLLAAGADVNIKNNDGHTALRYAGANDHLEALQVLLSNGADPHIASEDGYTLLMRAAYYDSLKVVRVLVKHHTNLNQQNEIGHTALMVAAARGHIDIVSELLDGKADCSIRDECGNNAVMFACSYQDSVSIVELLLATGIDLNVKNKNNWTALMLAAQSQNALVVAYLLEQGADPNVTNKQGLSVLSLASKHGNVGIVQKLLEFGAKPELTSLMSAVEAKSIEVVLQLITAGADPSAESENGETALMIACYAGSMPIMEILLNTTVDINHKEKQSGRTALFFAVANGFTDIAAVLISAGADPSIIDHHGLRAQDVASLQQNTEMYQVLALGWEQQSVVAVPPSPPPVDMINSGSFVPPTVQLLRALNNPLLLQSKPKHTIARDFSY